MNSKLYITSASGSSPYSFYMCGINLENCVFLGTGSTTTPTLTFLPPTIFAGASQVILKMIDTNNCENFKVLDCDSNCTFDIMIYDYETYSCLFKVSILQENGFFILQENGDKILI
jgi:hypothetical protein